MFWNMVVMSLNWISSCGKPLRTSCIDQYSGARHMEADQGRLLVDGRPHSLGVREKLMDVAVQCVLRGIRGAARAAINAPSGCGSAA
jgi:hypothetical protein